MGRYHPGDAPQRDASAILKWCCVVLGLILAVLVIYIVAQLLHGKSDEPKKAASPTPRAADSVTADPQAEPEQKRVTSISFAEAGSPDAKLALKPGDRQTLTPVLEPEGAAAQITWSSSDPQIVSVDSGGTVSCLAPGVAVITAEADGVTVRVTIEVTGATQSAANVVGTPVDTYLGAHFTVPDGFQRKSITAEAGNLYLYYSDALGMQIYFFEIAKTDRPDADSARACIENDYRQNHEGVMGLGGEITYQSQKENKWVLSGYLENGSTIFYRCEIASDDDYAVYTISFEYPTSNAERCNRIVDALMNSFTYNR